MNLVLAIEPDSSQADPLSSVVRAKLGAELVVVSSAYAAIVAMNQRVPDVVLFGRTVSQEQRVKITAHLRSTHGSSPVRTLDIPQLAAPAPAERSGFQNPFRKKEAVTEIGDVPTFVKQLGVLLAAAENARPTVSDTPAAARDAAWDEVKIELDAIPEPPAVPNAGELVELPPLMDLDEALAVAPTQEETESDIRSADISLIEAEVEFRLKAELERVQAEATRQQSRELARIEAEAAEQRRREFARIESEAATQRESAVSEARAGAEAAARESLAAELARVRSEAEQQLASEIARVRSEAAQALEAQVGRTQAESAREHEDRLAHARSEAHATHAAVVEDARRAADAAAAGTRGRRDARRKPPPRARVKRKRKIARVKAEADAARVAAIEEARRAAEAEATRALEAEIARVKADTDAQVQAAVARARAESEAQLARRSRKPRWKPRRASSWSWPAFAARRSRRGTRISRPRSTRTASASRRRNRARRRGSGAGGEPSASGPTQTSASNRKWRCFAPRRSASRLFTRTQTARTHPTGSRKRLRHGARPASPMGSRSMGSRGGCRGPRAGGRRRRDVAPPASLIRGADLLGVGRHREQGGQQRREQGRERGGRRRRAVCQECACHGRARSASRRRDHEPRRRVRQRGAGAGRTCGPRFPGGVFAHPDGSLRRRPAHRQH